MAKTLKFVYVMILFTSLFLFAKNVVGYINCKTDDDCPKLESRMVVLKCTNSRCAAVILH
uniref:Late nodulin n=2 Tax=Medicago truncatula TaxID=3880 RepID=A2Q5B1_MEDTR|nr:Late nodulin [Medicago truncatula]